MRRLFWRIFISFWVAMILIVAGAAATVYWIVSDMRANPPSQADTLILYNEIERVAAGGDAADLKTWLEEREATGKQPDVYAFDSSRREVLGRRPPPPVVFRSAQWGAGPGPPVDSPRRMFTTMTLDGERFLFVVAPDVSRLSRWLMPLGPGPVHWPALVIAVIVTAATCLLLARYFSAPIDKLRQATLEVASGNLNVRVRPSLAGRRDELGLLASDFDHMADRLRALRDSRQQLMRDLSHELRSPLARLQVALELARRSTGHGVEPQLNRIEREAARIDALVGQILMLSQLNDPSAAVNRERFDARDLLELLVQDSNLEAAGRGIAVELNKPVSEPCWLHADRQLISSAIENVLRNAIRYSPDGGKVDVTLQVSYSEVRIAILDRGPGVPAAELQAIFEPFYRASPQGSLSVRGHGLGLAIAHRIVSLHYGTVFARLRDGDGLAIEFCFPEG